MGRKKLLKRPRLTALAPIQPRRRELTLRLHSTGSRFEIEESQKYLKRNGRCSGLKTNGPVHLALRYRPMGVRLLCCEVDRKSRLLLINCSIEGCALGFEWQKYRLVSFLLAQTTLPRRSAWQVRKCHFLAGHRPFQL